MEKNGEPNHKFQFMGVEKEDVFNLNLITTRRRLFNPQLGRFMGIDLMSDMIPTVSPFVYSFNNPVNLNDPSGLFAKDTTYEGGSLDEIVITAQAERPITIDIWIWLGSSSNPIARDLASAYLNDRSRFNHLISSPKTIHWSDNFGEETDFARGVRVIGSCLGKGVIYASIAMFAAPAIVEAAPLLLSGGGRLALQGGRLALQNGRLLGNTLTNVARDNFQRLSIRNLFIDAGLQAVINTGFNGDPVGNYDLLDGGFSAINIKNPFSAKGAIATIALQGAAALIDIKPFKTTPISINSGAVPDFGTGTVGAFSSGAIGEYYAPRVGDAGATAASTTSTAWLKMLSEIIKNSK